MKTPLFLITFLFLAFIGCSTGSKQSVPLNDDRLGAWELGTVHGKLNIDPVMLHQDFEHARDEVILVPQWHLSPQTNTRNLKTEIPQAKNQNAIFHMLSRWIQDGFIDSVVIEGCEGDLGKQGEVSYNGWSLNDLKNEKETGKDIDPVQTHVGLKLMAQFAEKVSVKCGDTLKLIKDNQLALSDVRGLFGFKVRIEQRDLTLTERERFVSGAKEVLSLPKKIPDDEVIAKLNAEIQSSISKFENLIQKRNDHFLSQLILLKGRKVLIVGALHIKDLESKLSVQGLPFSVWRPVGLGDDETSLIEKLKFKFKVPAHD